MMRWLEGVLWVVVTLCVYSGALSIINFVHVLLW